MCWMFIYGTSSHMQVVMEPMQEEGLTLDTVGT